MQKNKNTLTWLHLSDLHYCKPRTGWDAKDILVHLPTDLREMEKQYGLRPDLVLFTGDLAFGNLKPDPGWNLEDQYAGVAQFLESVRGAFSRKIPRSHVFIVPGNHDVDRADVSRFVTPWLDALKSDDEIIDMIHKGGRDWQDCIQRLHAYRKFLEIHDYNHLLTDSERLVYAIQQEINGITVGIGGLNSAWSCSRPSNEEKGKLWMGARWQAKIIHDALKGSDLTLALAHHPPGWMARSEEVFLKTGALEKFHFFFHGHEHNDWPLTIDGRHVTLSAGACYKRSDKKNGYNMGCIDMNRGTCEIHFRRYSDKGTGGWTPHVIPGKTDDLGVYRMADFAGFRKVAEPVQEEEGVKAAGQKDKTTRITRSQVGVVGDSARIEGGIHFHHHAFSSIASDSENPVERESEKETELPDPVEAEHTGKSPTPKRPQTKTLDPVQEDEIRAYCRKAEALHEKLPLIGFKTNLKVPIDIADIYVPLRAMIDLRATGRSHFADAEEAEKCLRGHCAENEISVPDAFKEAEKMTPPRRGIVILGDPGSGKTTHLKRVLLWCLREGATRLGLPKDIIPVFLPIRELKNTNSSLDDFIQEQLNHPLLKTPEGFGRRLLKRGKLLFLLDGLDEVADPDKRCQVSRWIETALKLYGDCRFVVTCRFAGYTDEVRLYAVFWEMHIRPMSEEHAETFIRKWYRIVETGISSDKSQAEVIANEKAEGLIDRLQKPDFRARRIFEMTRNPLLLTNFCLVHHSRNDLPHTRSLLYEECIDVLLEKWRSAIRFPSRVTAQTGRRVLQPAAYWLHQKEQRTRGSATELAPVIEPALKAVNWRGGTSEDFLHAVRDESGLLTGWSQGQFGFMHLGFQEYLAAREIQWLFLDALGKTDVLRQLAARFGEGWWQEVILLLLAQADHCLFKPFMREVMQQSGFAAHSEFLAMCLEEAAEKSVEPFLELLALDPTGNPEGLWDRQLAVLPIVERLESDALALFVSRLLNHPHDKVRQWMDARFAKAGPEVLRAPRGGYELVKIPGGGISYGLTRNRRGAIGI